MRQQIAEFELLGLEHSQPDKRIRHINAVLRAICNVNQLIVREKDRDKLLKKICESLIETHVYYNTWIALLDKSGNLVTSAEAGLGKYFLSMIEQLGHGELPACCQRAMRQSDVVVTQDLLFTCANCPLSTMHSGRGTITVRLEYNGKIYGLFSVSTPIDFATDEEGQALFEELSSDLSFALYSIELQEEQRRAEEKKKKLDLQLRYAQKMKTLKTFAGGIAHNFNNLLMSIQGNASLMLLETDSGHSHYRRLKNIEKSVQSGSMLTSQLLGYTREGRYEVKLINVNQIVKQTSDIFGTTKKDIVVHRELAEDLCEIKADQKQIEQVLMILYINSADAMPKGGDLYLKTINVTHEDISSKPYNVKPGNYVFLTVRDAGIGIDAMTIEHIFDPFFTTKGLGKSTGLGLSSAYGIIKGHGGYIDVNSVKEQGTTFNIYLPVPEKEAL